MVVSIAIDMKSLQNVWEGNSAGAIIPASDRTRTMLKIFDPIIFPKAISWLFFNALINDAASSGRLVPRAIIVKPITSSDTPSNSAIVWELFTVKSAPTRRTIRPIKKGTIALPHSYGRLQFGADLELHFRTMIGTGSNPNVAAVIVIGIEPKWTKRIVDGIAKTGKPVEGFHIERTGDIGTVMKASKKAQEFVMWASEKQREECPISDLWISVKCGESDTTSGLASNPTVGNLMDKLEPLGVHLCFGETSELTGAEKVCATRGATKEASDKFMKTWSAYNDFILKEATNDLSESQPTAGNIAGGLTTIEEKAFGNFQKIGSCKFVDVLEPAEEPTKGKGLYFMDTSSAAAECVTLQAAAGFNIHLFPTGQGNIVGNPIEPVVKLTANPLTVKSMGEHIDCDVSKILSREMNLSEAGDKLIETTLRVANGRLTCAEALGHREFVMTKLYRSA